MAAERGREGELVAVSGVGGDAGDRRVRAHQRVLGAPHPQPGEIPGRGLADDLGEAG